MNKSESEIPKPFDPEEFRNKGHQVIDILSDYLNDTLSGKKMAVLPLKDPDQLTKMFSFESEKGQNEPFDLFVKRIIAYTALKYYSESYYKEYIDSRYNLAASFADIIKSKSDFELAVEPQSNIVCFRYAPKGHTDQILNRINSEIRERIIKEGSFYIVQAELDSKIWLRLTIINPVTAQKDLEDLLLKIKEIVGE